MRSRLLLLARVLLVALPVCLLVQPGVASARQVNVIRVESVISPSSADYIVTAIKQAEKDKVAALVIELDTPGGLDTSMRVIIKEMLAAERPIVVYVAPSGARAASAGAFITVAAHIAAMAPGTNIGAAAPVAMGGQMDKTMEKKVTNDAAAYMRTIAEKRGRPIDLAEEWVRKATAKTETEALKTKLIDVISPKLDDLLQAIDGRVVTTAAGKVKIETKNAVVHREDMNLREKILRVITDPTIAYLLLILGLAGLYFEFSTPGAILPGVLGGISLILALYAFQQLPINYAGVLLILLAIVMFIAEIKVVSHGVLTAGGIAAMILGSMMLINTPAPFMRISLTAIIGTAAATAGFFLFVVGAGVKALRTRTVTGMEGLIGEIGVVRTRLAPRGQVFLRGELWNAEGDGVVETGESVRITGMDGLTLKVVPVQRATAASDPVATGRSG
ncbi:MAG: nodulation protein NfeD [candidate division NC10 bacterium]|nr:nodulation protein NfeD [candidate division NC10 bacterium]MBI2163861.1 nodulation protein NfeD [candidate division NC10 bacterium]MBI2456733.1 nodulation protein NfeD [candidate division NC10 bacterium]MBI2562881.1 nodulation protein NfeD [candidate division NC10 bacterium]